MGRYDEARSALEKGAAIATHSGDPYVWLAELDALQGRCEDEEREARRAADIDRSQGTLALLFASVGLRRPEATLRELAAQMALAQPTQLQGVFRALGETFVWIGLGRFTEARASGDRLASEIAKALPTAYMFQYWCALLRVEVALEAGDVARAQKLAADFVARRDTWTQSMYPHGSGAVDLTLWLARVANDRAGAVDALRPAWLEEQLRDGVVPGLVWSYGWAAPARTREDALAALDAREHDARMQPPLIGISLAVTPGGLPDAYAGRALLLAGRPADALLPLRRASSACGAGFVFVEGVHASVDLGQALEQTGDAKGACGAYASVLAKWGRATPRSVSADAARAALKRLRCE
jgi:serine/threonine-protein kinase